VGDGAVQGGDDGDVVIQAGAVRDPAAHARRPRDDQVPIAGRARIALRIATRAPSPEASQKVALSRSSTSRYLRVRADLAPRDVPEGVDIE
jgi:uridine phosphorylase